MDSTLLGQRCVAFLAVISLLAETALGGADCNKNGADDAQEIAGGVARDCNKNGVPDECDVTPDFRLQAALSFELGLAPISVARGDLDRDGDLDLAVALPSQSIALLLNDGHGALTRLNGPMVNAPPSLELADLDEDGDMDLVLCYGGGVLLLPNNGDLTFGEPVNLPLSGGWSVAAGDLDGDDRLDLVVDAKVFLNQGNLAFSSVPAPGVTTSPNSSAIALGDLDADGKLDIALADRDSNSLAVLLNNGRGDFRPPRRLAAGPLPTSVFALDVDQDGDLDLAVNHYNTPNVSIFFNRGGGVFDPPVDFSFALGAIMASGDLSGDGECDIIFTFKNSTSLTLLLTGGRLGYAGSPGFRVGKGPGSVAAGDLDGDGLPDLAVANSVSNSVSVLRNTGGGAFGAAVELDVGARPGPVVSVDLDGDGRPDLVSANRDSANVSVILNAGDGAFAPAFNVAAGDEPSSLAAADLDGDGRPDLAVANPGPGTVSLLRNTGKGVFARWGTVAAGAKPGIIAAGDLDGDGDVDLAVANLNSRDVSILLNGGNGAFADPLNLAVGDSPFALALADLDGDGDLDLLMGKRDTQRASSKLTVLVNRGNAAFEAGWSTSVAGTLSFVAPVDMDGDGRLDLVLGGGNTISVLLSQGGFKFREGITYALSGPSAVSAADLDRDGRLDLAVAGFSFERVFVVLNITRPPFAADGDHNGIPDACERPAFLRGDANVDGEENLSDPVSILLRLFLGGASLTCERSADSDGSGVLDLTDAVYLLNHLFFSGPEPPPPYPGCGPDPVPEGLSCGSYPPCR